MLRLPVLVVSGVNDHRKIVISLMVAMGNFYAVLLRTVTPIFAISSMPLVAVKRYCCPLRDWRLVAAALIASFGLVPPLAWGVSRLLSLAEPFEIGLMFVAVSSGAPVIVMFVQSAGGNLALTGAMIVLLAIASVTYMPWLLLLARSMSMRRQSR